MPTLKDLARTKGLTLRQVGLAGAYASAINKGHYRAGADAIARLAQALGEPPERIAEVCDACWQAGEARRAAASAPATSLAASSPSPAVAVAPPSVPASAPAGKGW